MLSAQRRTARYFSFRLARFGQHQLVPLCAILPSMVLLFGALANKAEGGVAEKSARATRRDQSKARKVERFQMEQEDSRSNHAFGHQSSEELAGKRRKEEATRQGQEAIEMQQEDSQSKRAFRHQSTEEKKKKEEGRQLDQARRQEKWDRKNKQRGHARPTRREEEEARSAAVIAEQKREVEKAAELENHRKKEVARQEAEARTKEELEKKREAERRRAAKEEGTARSEPVGSLKGDTPKKKGVFPHISFPKLGKSKAKVAPEGTVLPKGSSKKGSVFPKLPTIR